ncbi:MAG: hypothetical protein KGP10_00675 [Actinomycetales bacterium]|nr:hypothetical protein [Actinomycetales bacterium]
MTDPAGPSQVRGEWAAGGRPWSGERAPDCLLRARTRVEALLATGPQTVAGVAADLRRQRVPADVRVRVIAELVSAGVLPGGQGRLPRAG